MRRVPSVQAFEHVTERDILANIALGRVGQPADIANLCAWLLSDEAGFVTGQNYVSDGGMTRKMIYV